MEARVVHSVFLIDPPDLFPALNIHRRMSGLGKQGALEVAAHEGGFAVDEKLVALACDFAETEAHQLTIDRKTGRQKIHMHLVKCRIEFTPEARGARMA